MLDSECVELLRWALPRLHMRWKGFRKVRRQVCKRITRRMQALNLPDGKSYREFLLTHPLEWYRLDGMCRITISRFYRDREVFNRLGSEVLPRLARTVMEREGRALRVWSAGCASGEEPYTVVCLWEHRVRAAAGGVTLRIIGSDAEPGLIERARAACYGAASLKEMPAEWVASGFFRRDGLYCLREAYRRCVAFELRDIRTSSPQGPFDMILCRNLAFTYFEIAAQIRILERLHGLLVPGGALVAGKQEKLPELNHGFEHWCGALGIYRKSGQCDAGG